MRSPHPARPWAGPAFALGAFLSWGLSPLYFKALARVPAWEVLLHRVVWTLVLLAAAAAVLGRLPRAWAAWRAPAARRALLVTTPLIALNWLLFIWAVTTRRVLEASLGYFINPLVNVVLGRFVLGERLRRAQAAAVAIAAASVVLLTATAGRPPWVALALGVSFGFYGLFRKLAPVDSMTGLLVETGMLFPFALAGLCWLGATGRGALFGGSAVTSLLLLAAGVVTAVPLLCFVAAARRLTLTTLGFFQYLAPTCHLLLGVLVWHEPFAGPRILAFFCIWAALALVSADAVVRNRAGAAD
jgi:chloramphenicol-sensitive protein RarD